MSTSNKAGSRTSRGSAARAEGKGPKQAEVFGIKLDLVSEAPPTFGFDLMMLQSGDGASAPGSIGRFLQGLGVTTEQMLEAREKVANGEVKIPKDEDALGYFFNQVIEQFGVSAGN